MLEVGDKAYNFSLLDQSGNKVSLSDYLGSKVIVYFYPKDNTPGCTRQACAFRDNYDELKNLGLDIIGISKDSITSHKNFTEKYNLPFILLADPELEAINGFGVFKEKNIYGKKTMGVVRSTFIIDERGYVEKVFPKAKSDTNALEIIKYFQEK